MATNDKPPYAYGGPVVQREQQPLPEDARCTGCGGATKIMAAIIMFAGIGVAISGLIYMSHWRSDGDFKHKLEIKQLGDVEASLCDLAKDEAKTQRLRSPEIVETRGAAFYEAAIKQGLLDDMMVSKLVSLNSKTDSKPDKEWIEDPDGHMPEHSCSYTGPMAGELAALLKREGEDRVVLITFNANNWNNYSDRGIIVFWTGADTAEYRDFDYFQEAYGITKEEWADPAHKLFGKKAPFQYTYE